MLRNRPHPCFWALWDYLRWTLGAETWEGFLEEVMLRLAQQQEWLSRMSGWGRVRRTAHRPHEAWTAS